MTSSLATLVGRARRGDLDAYGQVVDATRTMAVATAFSVLRDTGLAQDAAQDAFLRAFRRLAELDEAAAFPGWLRRIVITVALNQRRRHRQTLLCLDELPDLPVLDAEETRWSEQQRQRLASAILTLPADERRLCDRRYHGGWDIARLAKDAAIEPAAMRKRLQRIRGKLRKEMEMNERHEIESASLDRDMPAKVVELLARPRLTDLPENPVGRTLDDLRRMFGGFTDVELPEVVDLTGASQTIREVALYVKPSELHQVDGDRILRYDLTLPLLLKMEATGSPLRLWAAGKAYRLGQPDALHLEAFHQPEALWLDRRDALDPWQVTALVLRAVDELLPGRAVKIVPTDYPMCRQAWELEVEQDDGWSEILAWGEFVDPIVAHLGADPATHIALGFGCGLERIAMVRYGIDDIRKIDVESVA